VVQPPPPLLPPRLPSAIFCCHRRGFVCSVRFCKWRGREECDARWATADTAPPSSHHVITVIASMEVETTRWSTTGLMTPPGRRTMGAPLNVLRDEALAYGSRVNDLRPATSASSRTPLPEHMRTWTSLPSCAVDPVEVVAPCDILCRHSHMHRLGPTDFTFIARLAPYDI
jgi:hypothetical protein